jgi:serine/threonine-protein phosphatase 5
MREMIDDHRPPASDFRDMIQKIADMHRKMPNTVSITISGTIHVVGDVHGQYMDVVALFEAFGNPSAQNPYLFNGDFVDRGSMGVEVLIALFAWKLADPRSLYLNRGNQFVLLGGSGRLPFSCPNTQ